jgi:hypothetical protein
MFLIIALRLVSFLISRSYEYSQMGLNRLGKARSNLSKLGSLFGYQKELSRLFQN